MYIPCHYFLSKAQHLFVFLISRNSRKSFKERVDELEGEREDSSEEGTQESGFSSPIQDSLR